VQGDQRFVATAHSVRPVPAVGMESMKKLFAVILGLVIGSYASAAPAQASKPAHAAPEVRLVGSQQTFSSFEEAIAFVRRSYRGEFADTSRSSWIRGAEYYEAGGQEFLILNMNGKDYIFRGVPVSVWQEFKSAPSPGQFYNSRIRGRYHFALN